MRRGDIPIPQTTWIFDDGYADLKWLKKWWRRKKRIEGKRELRERSVDRGMGKGRT